MEALLAGTTITEAERTQKLAEFMFGKSVRLVFYDELEELDADEGVPPRLMND